MKNIIAILTVFLALVPGHLALAQSTGDLGNILGDVLGGLLSGRQGDETRSWHGHLVQATGTTMIFRAENGKIYAVDVSAIDTRTWHPIELGQALTLAAKPGPEPNTLIAARLQADPPDRSTGKATKKPFLSDRGTIESVENSEFRFKTTDGRVVWADASQMPGRAAVRVNDQGTLTYERDSRQRVTALWLERSETQPSAAIIPRAVGPGEYQRR